MHKLTLAMIVKNEAPNILECLESVAPYICSYVIADTGSTDNTKVKPYLVAIIKLNGRQDLIKVRNRYLLIS